jgi:hypothetical protein
VWDMKKKGRGFMRKGRKGGSSGRGKQSAVVLYSIPPPHNGICAPPVLDCADK